MITGKSYHLKLCCEYFKAGVRVEATVLIYSNSTPINIEQSNALLSIFVKRQRVVQKDGPANVLSKMTTHT